MILFPIFILICKSFFYVTSILSACIDSSLSPESYIINDAIVIDEYKQQHIPFTLSVSGEEAQSCLNVLPALNIRQQVLGYNGWEATLGPDCENFHQAAEAWHDNQYDEYFRKGLLQEIIFLLTGVGDNWKVKKFWNKRDHSINDECRARIILSLYHEAELLRKTSNDSGLLHVAIAEHIRTPEILQDSTDSPFCKTVKLSRSSITKEQISPTKYEKYFFTSQLMQDSSAQRHFSETQCISLIEEDNQLSRLTLCVEHVMTQMIGILSNDLTTLNLARKFHKQKLIEERLYQAQRQRLENQVEDDSFKSIGQAFEREHNLADIINRALFHLIKAKLHYAYQTYIEPIQSNNLSFMNNEYVINEEFLPSVNYEAMHAYIPGFMNDPSLKRILDAEYIEVN